jgi:SAM-dependent methyltransferase
MLFGRSPEHLRRYAAVGQSAISNIQASLRAAGLPENQAPRRVLDFPSGYGRVLRYMKVAWPNASFTAADLDPRGVRFCATEFGAKPLMSHVDFSRIAFPEQYDLIFVGSLVTHLTGESGVHLLEVLAGALEPGGILIFSTQCDLSDDRLRSYGRTTAGLAETIRTATLARGNYYNPADRMAFHTPDWIRSSMSTRCPRLELVHHAPQGWDNHQDIWAYRRPPR